MKRMSKKWLALMLAASLVLSEGSFVSLAQTADAANTVVETTVEDGVESTEEASEESSEEASEESSEEASEESSEEASEESSEEASEESSEEASEESSEEASEESTEEASEESSEEVAEVKMFPGVTEGVSLGKDDAVLREDLIENMDNAGNFEEGVDCVANEILVMAESEELASEYAAAFNGVVASYVDGVAVITLNANEDLPKASVKDAVMASADPSNNLPVAWPNTIYSIQPIEIESYSVSEEVAVAVEDETVAADSVENELAEGEEYNNLLGYNDPYLKTTSSSYQWFHTSIGSAYAWNSGYTGSGVKVAVIDTGAEVGHEDLNVTRMAVSSLNGDLEDAQGHGTHVCGLVGAIANNGKGGTGVAPGVTLYSIKLANSGSFSTSVILEAMSMAKNQNVDIVNMSLGGPAYNGTFAAKVQELYDAGIAVICAAGNESTSAWAYPASYPGAISIAALDRSMQRTFFSNHGSTTDFSAPGYQTYSTYNASSSSYTSMSGTSMACPIAAGTAAVVLQYARQTGAYTENNTSKDVDNLVKAMTKGAVKSGTGTGKGYVSLPKALGLSTAVTAPKAPTFSVKAGSYNAASVSVAITAEAGTRIYYSTNGKTPTYKNGIVSNGTIYRGQAVTVGGNKTVTLKAIAISSTNMVSKVASAKYTLKPQVSSLSLAVQGGVAKIEAGKSAVITATIAPAYAANKKLDWTVAPAGQGVTVKNGKVTATKKATAGTYTITATTKDGSNISKSISIAVVAANANPITKITKVTKGNVTLVNGDSAQVEVQVTLKDKTTAAANAVTWTTENSSVATVTASNTNVITIKGIAKGKTNIVGTAADGSGVKIKIPVTVGNKVSSITLNANSQLTVGKSVTIAATINPSDAANKKLDWTISPANQGVTVKNGKVTATKKATVGAYTVTATAADGKGATKSITINVVNSPITKIALGGSKTVNLFRVANGMGAQTSETIPVTVTGGNTDNWEVTSSAPGIVNAYRSGNNVVVTATGNGTGSATVTVKSTDGTNKKATCKVVVKNPVSKLHLSVPGGRGYDIANGKSLQLKAVFETEYGKVDASSKKLKWTSSNPTVLSVSAGGKVTAKANTGYAIITATTTDGSGISASIELYATVDIKQIKFSDTSGKTITSIRIPVGYAQYVYADPYVSWGVTGSFYPDEDLATSVSGNGGVGVLPDGYLYTLVGNKKGTYTFTVYCQNGSTAKGKLKVTVY